MHNLENKMFTNIIKPPVCVQYIDDILLANNFKETFEENFVLHFTYEVNIKAESLSLTCLWMLIVTVLILHCIKKTQTPK